MVVMEVEAQPEQQAATLDPCPPRRRRRPALSCLECRRRKIKCDQKSPCTHCSRHKTLCAYRDDVLPIRRRRTPASTTSAPSPDPASPSRAALRTPGQQPPPNGNTSSDKQEGPSAPLTVSRDYGIVSGGSNLSSNYRAPGHSADIQGMLRRIQKLEESTNCQQHNHPSKRAIFCGNHPDPSSIDEPGDWKQLFTKPRDMGKGGWVNGAQEFDLIIACWVAIVSRPSETTWSKDPETHAMVCQAGDILRQCKKIAKTVKRARPTRSLLSSSSFLAPPSREISDTMVDLYFASFESTHRILHFPTFSADYQRYWDSADTAPAELRLAVLLVIGIGSSLRDHGTPDATIANAELVHHWIYAAETWLAGPLEKDRVSIPGLQVYCLTILARQVFAIGGDTVWMSTGSLIHRAMQLGLHRDPTKLPGQRSLTLQNEIRRRLWATILELVVQASLDSRMPPRISFDEFDTRPPSNVDDADMDDTTSVLEPHHKARFTDTSIQIALLESLPNRLKIVQLLMGLGTEHSYPRVLELSSELTSDLQKNTILMKNTERNISTPFRRNLLDYLLRRFIIPLHFFFSNQAHANPMYYYSLKLSIDTATAIMTPEPDDGFARLMVSGGGLFREGVRLCSMATGLELLLQAQAQSLDGTLARVGEYREHLKRGIRDMAALSEERIRLGETNVKNHMFLCMILAAAEAIEKDLPVELEVARGARDSLEHCHGILMTRVEKLSLASTPDTGLGASADEMEFGVDGYSLGLDWETLMADQGFFGEMVP
ncbi:hypothetical protein V2G26_001870 [Clonostachys chloroleuca]